MYVGVIYMGEKLVIYTGVESSGWRQVFIEGMNY